MKKLSLPQKRVLANLLAGREATHGLSGRSESGGFVRTYRWLRRNCLAVETNGRIFLTEEGRKVAQEACLS